MSHDILKDLEKTKHYGLFSVGIAFILMSLVTIFSSFSKQMGLALLSSYFLWVYLSMYTIGVVCVTLGTSIAVAKLRRKRARARVAQRRAAREARAKKKKKKGGS